DKQYNGLLLNLSCGGCQVVVESKDQDASPKVAVDEDITLEFKMFASDKNMNLAGKVKNINVNDTRIYLGVKYNELSEDIENEIKDYITNVTDYLEE
ncbi:MAG: PilZ domain-containing protein, partial [Thermodesulfobacteriota bacterium]|nr:PilZ domain-containing protein [Thermodesulfobacteriota bacterium]